MGRTDSIYDRKRSPCFYVDDKNANSVNKRDSCLVPQMVVYIDLLGEVAVFSSLAASSGYMKPVFEDINCDKTAFTSHRGL